MPAFIYIKDDMTYRKSGQLTYEELVDFILNK